MRRGRSPGEQRPMSTPARRHFLFSSGAALAASLAARALAAPAAPAAAGKVVKNGRLKQSVCRWCYAKIPLPEFCAAIKGIGLTAIDLLGEKDWPLLRDSGLVCSMAQAGGGSIPEGFNDKR